MQKLVQKGSGVSLVVLSANFEVALWMCANRANFRGFCSNDDVATVAAFPDFNFALFEYSGCFNVLKKCSVALFVMFFDCTYSTEFAARAGKPSASAVFAKSSYISVHS